MFWLMIILILSFVAVAFYLSRAVTLQIEQRADEDVLRTKESYQSIIEKKEKAAQEKEKLEEEAAQIFTLYDMMRDITKNFDRKEAFKIFCRKLKENVRYKECLLLDMNDERIKKFSDEEGHILFLLQSKKRKLGYLACLGIPQSDVENFTILAHQFALALRRIGLYQEVEQLATTDSLTNVYTRRYFGERFEEEMKRSKARKIPLSLLMIDADHFKSVNDEYGHLAGDQVLKEIVGIIKDNIREIDIAGRYGGEEFAVILPDTDVDGARVVAERMRSAVENTLIQAFDAKIQVTVSIGMSNFPNDGREISELFDKADWALYRAKKDGRNQVCAFGVYGNT